MGHWTASLVSAGIEALKSRPAKQGAVGTVFNAIVGYPIKVLAAFITAPFLILRLAARVQNPVRRWIARIGLVSPSSLLTLQAPSWAR